MKASMLVIFLVFGSRLLAQDTFNVTLTVAPPTPPDTLRGKAVLTLQDSRLDYEVNLTGRYLGNFGPGEQGPIPAFPVITLGGVDSRTPLHWFIASLGPPNFDRFLQLPGAPPLPDDYYWAHYEFRGSATISELMAADLVHGMATLTVDYGLWGTVSGSIVRMTNAALKIEKITLEDSQIARFSVSGPPGSAFVIEGSSDCKTWGLLTPTNSPTIIFIVSPEGRADGIGARREGPMLFYRLRATNALPVLKDSFQTPQ